MCYLEIHCLIPCFGGFPLFLMTFFLIPQWNFYSLKFVKVCFMVRFVVLLLNVPCEPEKNLCSAFYKCQLQPVD
jgi:hypothetical protein